jgi:F0F1-type ATP synthase assembly protein I
MPEEEDSSAKPKKQINTYAQLSSMAIQMGVTIAAGVLAGDWLDEHYQNKTPIWTIVLSLFSIAIAFYFVIKGAKKLSKND